MVMLSPACVQACRWLMQALSAQHHGRQIKPGWRRTVHLRCKHAHAYALQVIVLLWSCISVPLCLLGTVVGRNWAGHPDNPCRVKRIPSPIPQKQVNPAFAAPGIAFRPLHIMHVQQWLQQ